MSDKDKRDRGRDREGGDKPKGPPPPRTGHVAPADPQLAQWLERLWTRDNHPERLEVWRVVGSNRDVRRAMVFYENFKQDDPLDLERCTKLSGEILSAAHNDCDCAEKRCLYEIAILDSYQQAGQPLLRRLGPLIPQRGYAGVRPDGEPKGAEEEDGEDDGTIGIKPLSHKYVSRIFRSLHRTMEQVHVMMGDFMQLQQGGLLSAHSHNERLQNANMALYGQMQDAADRSLDREVIRDKEKMKIKAIGDGIGIGRNMLYRWFGEGEGGGDTGEGDKGTGGAAPTRRRLGSEEQMLLEGFLKDCKDEKLSVQLFGDWKDTDDLTLPDVFAGFGLQTPGIFTHQQFGILLSVASGQLPADAIDALLPGGAQAITKEQMVQVLPLLTKSMLHALERVQQIRTEKKEKQGAQLESGAKREGEPT